MTYTVTGCEVTVMLVVFCCALALDALLGDPQGWFHPVVLIGRLANTLTRRISGLARTAAERRRGGIALLTLTALCAGGGAAAIAFLARAVHPLIELAVEIALLASALAGRCLADEAMKVKHSLDAGDIKNAREQAGMLVGRDTQDLPPHEVARAAIETVAENTGDGVLSPMFWWAAGALLLGGTGGAALCWAFKAVSTLDSMVGYKNDTYIDLGRASALADDAMNYIPARIAGVLLCVCAVYRGGMVRAFRILKRDHKKHESPNSAWGESAVAGALGVRLGGPSSYGGAVSDKPTLGDALRPIESADIARACGLMFGSEAVFALLITLLLWSVGR